MTYLILVPAVCVGVVGVVLVKKGKSWGAFLCLAAAVFALAWTLAPESWFQWGRGGPGQGQRFAASRDAALAEAIGVSVRDRLTPDARVLVVGRGGWGGGNNNAPNNNANTRNNAFIETWKKGLTGSADSGVEIVFVGGRNAQNTAAAAGQSTTPELPQGPFTLVIADSQRVAADFPLSDVAGAAPVVLISDQPTKPEAPANWKLASGQVIEVVFRNGDKYTVEASSGQ